jgi:hypothetical protein
MLYYFRLCHVVLAVLATSVAGTGQLKAEEATADFATKNEVIVGDSRVVLLSVTRFTEFVAGEGGKGPRAVRSLRLLYLQELLVDGSTMTVGGAEVFAAGSADQPVRFPRGGNNTMHSSKNYGGYSEWLKSQADEWSAAKLPTVKDPNMATIAGVTLRDVEVTAKKADVRVKLGNDDSVLFKNVPLE